ncbi:MULTISPECIES: hypothetical protein [Proteus]|uniref:hypothetical protein n=1 Tax=Proteus TaxID=583 RepID=UPI0013781515|nr:MULTISPECIES: hypothetical protein [Proteus]MBG5950860.1 hypothetical protein [Proteus terrae]MCE9838111.1 hypothetical protein [Proteus terrae]NBN69700.1 hypothetical protein [Proteus sp. G2618]
MDDYLTKQAIVPIVSGLLLFTTPHVENTQILTPIVLIYHNDLPQYVSEGNEVRVNKENTASIALYHKLKDKFGLSHTQFSSWLGLKRRSLYNWLNEPDSSRNRESIEIRLSNLNFLMNEMDQEHRHLLYKIAFSPIDGDPALGEALLNGASKDELCVWYDKLYEKFEQLV